MNVGQLKALIKYLPDDTLIVRDGGDHSYIIANLYKDTVLVAYNSRHMYEDYGDFYKKNEKDNRINVLIVN